jgi:hypothetical protein
MKSQVTVNANIYYSYYITWRISVLEQWTKLIKKGIQSYFWAHYLAELYDLSSESCWYIMSIIW